MVYAPADGLVQEGAYLWSTQVHKIWQVPVVSTITLAPATDYAIAGVEDQTLVATVKDQFGRPMPNVEVSLTDVDKYGVFGAQMEGTLTMLFEDLAPQTTDGNGQVSFAVYYDDLVEGDWGVEKIFASAEGKMSNYAYIQWIYVDEAGDWDLVAAYNGEQKVYVFGTDADDAGWDGKTLKPYLNPGGNVAGALGSGVFVAPNDMSISTNLHTWIDGEYFFVNASNSSNTDEVPNWVWDMVEVF